MIAGTVVRCVPPDYMVLFYTGYPLDEGDFRDTSALCAKFGIELPARGPCPLIADHPHNPAHVRHEWGIGAFGECHSR